MIWKEVNQNEQAPAQVFHEHKSSVNTISWLVGRLMAVSRSSLPGLMVIGTLVELNKPIQVGRLLLCGFQTCFPRLCLDAGCSVLFLNWGSDNTVRVWKFYNGVWKMECLCAALEVR